MKGDKQTARECYLVSIRPLVERTKEQGLDRSSQAEKHTKTGPAAMALETLVIHTLTSEEPSRPGPEATGEVEEALLEEEWPAHTVQLG